MSEELKEFREALKKVKNNVECQYNEFDIPIAFNVKNEEEYKIVLDFVNLGKMSRNDHTKHYEYDYKGADWYFFKHTRSDEGMDGVIEEYKQVTLKDKSKELAKYTKEFYEKCLVENTNQYDLENSIVVLKMVKSCWADQIPNDGQKISDYDAITQSIQCIEDYIESEKRVRNANH